MATEIMRQYQFSVITVNYNTAIFIELMLEALRKLSINKYQVLIADNGSRKSDKKQLIKIVTLYPEATLFLRTQSQTGSTGHGEALDYLMTKVKAPFTAVLDADAVFLKKGWDQLLINEIAGNVKIIGTPPVKNPGKPADFPLMYATLLETETFNKLNISFMPGLVDSSKDTGWELREKYLANGNSGICFQVKNTRYEKTGPFKNVICSEYYYPDDSSLIASHFSRGSTIGANKYVENVPRFLRVPFIKNQFQKLIGKQEIKLWLSICRNIIDSEVSQSKLI